MHHLIDQRCAEIAQLCRCDGMRRLDVFGSTACGADFDPIATDADFLVDFDHWSDLPPLGQFFSLVRALERLFGRPVDRVGTNAIKNSFVLAEINRSR